MKNKLYLLISLGLIAFVFAQLDPNNAGDNFDGAASVDAAADDGEFASENDPGFVQKLVDFNLLGQGSRFEEPFHIENWSLRLDDSVEYPYNKNLTYIKVAKDNSGEASIGVRVNFPRVSIDTYAELKPVFDIPFLRTRFQDRGFIDNVGVIRSIRIKIRSNIFPYRVILVLQDKRGNLTEYRFNQRLNFYGWETIEWVNSRYENRFLYNQEDKKEPIYPLIVPGVRLHTIKFVRDFNVEIKGGYDPKGTDFVAYIRDIEMTFDKAVNDRLYLTEAEKNKPDYIDNENIWKIETDIENKLVNNELNRAFKNYRLNVLLQRARKRLDTPGINLDNLNDNETASPAGADELPLAAPAQGQ